MTHYKNYIKKTKETAPVSVAGAIQETVDKILLKITNFDFNSHKSGLLLGHVQSGKTAHMLGILAKAADTDFDIFIVMTTDSTALQQQTLKRAFLLLDTFCVCDEQDDVQFFANDMHKPVVIVLKKNYRVLETWKNHLISSNFLTGRGLFIIDDEGDAASLNTKVNKRDVSTINTKISDIKKLANSSFYLQVTATPQSLFLQEEGVGYKPEFVCYFKPGPGYIGGDFFYRSNEGGGGIKTPYPIRFTGEEELVELKENDIHIPNGMQKSIAIFLVSAAHIVSTKSKKSCNFLIHPSVRIADHENIAEKIRQILNNLFHNINEDDLFKASLKAAWIDLQITKPDILDFDKCYDFIARVLEKEEITISTMNSKTSLDVDFEEGINIIVGGNCLGRGVTFPNLQTTYYCRTSKKPQADTFWQHCRAFGYDRVEGLVRVYLPASLFSMFSSLNDANNAMIEYVEEHGIQGLRLIYPKGINPTRKNVLNKDKLEIIAGGVNHFPSFPTPKNIGNIDDLLSGISDETDFLNVEVPLIEDIIDLCETEFHYDWPKKTYIKCIKSLQEKDLKDAILIVRRNRNIGRNTGTLLSPDDRNLGLRFSNKLVLTMYRVNGSLEKGWDGSPLWIPNIKFPKGKFFYGTEE